MILGTRLPITFLTTSSAISRELFDSLPEAIPLRDGHGFVKTEKWGKKRVSATFVHAFESFERTVVVRAGTVEESAVPVRRTRALEVVANGKTGLELVGSRRLFDGIETGAAESLSKLLGCEFRDRSVGPEWEASLWSRFKSVTNLHYRTRDDKPIPRSGLDGKDSVSVSMSGGELLAQAKKLRGAILRMSGLVSVRGRELFVSVDMNSGTLVVFNKLRNPLTPQELFSFMDTMEGGESL